MYEVEWAKAFTKRHTNVYVVVHIQKLIPESRKSRVGVPDWHVAFFHLVCGVLFCFVLIRGKKCEDSMSEAHSLLKNLSPEVAHLCSHCFEENLVLGPDSMQRRLWSRVLAILSGCNHGRNWCCGAAKALRHSPVPV